MDLRTVFLDRIALLRRELDVLADLVDASPAPAPAPAGLAAPAFDEAQEDEELPPEPEPAPAPPAVAPPSADALVIGPAEAAGILGVARQTVDRRLKDGRTDVPGGPVDISQGSVRSRWRWASEADVRRWWDAVR